MQPGSGRHIHAGMRVGNLCVCGPPFLLTQNLSAVTGLCLLRKEKGLLWPLMFSK